MTKTIFFVEDEKALVKTLSEFLRAKGYRVEVAYNGLEALRSLPTVKPDLILLDIILPEMSGIDFLKEVQKEGAEYAAVPVLVLSNLQGDEGSFEKLGLKIEGYFVKANTRLEELCVKIEEVLNKKHHS